MTDAPLTGELLDAALEKMQHPLTHIVSYGSLDYLALRLEAEWNAGVADGSLKPEDLVSWANARLVDVFGVAIPQTERIPIAQPLGQTEKERGKWKRRT